MNRQLSFAIRTWGGRRDGAGRKPSAGRRNVSHRERPVHDPHHPVHAALRARALGASLRGSRVFGVVRDALACASSPTFRVLHYSVQTDHLHLIVEADAHPALVRGLQGLAIRIAKRVNRLLGRRGTVWDDRHHTRALTTPREVRNALVYVLNNWKKHGGDAPGRDPRSSASWFDGWRDLRAAARGAVPVVTARTWLVRVGWRRHGPIDDDERPAVPRFRRKR